MSVLLSGRGLTKSFSHRPLFAGLNLELKAGEKVALIGPNGAGKSTLLKILAGLEPADAGKVESRRGAGIGYLPQEDTFPPGQTPRQALLAAQDDLNVEDHERETAAAILLTQFAFEDPDRPAELLSGGWKKRLALARELVRGPDLLLMDEPTNHLDLPGVVWLEKLLRGAKFGYLVATHDRAFLRAVADDVIEVSRVFPDGLFRASGGFDNFAENKDLFLDAQERRKEAVANQVRKETDWLGRKESAQRKKSRARIGEAADRRGELAELKYRTQAANTAGIDFAGTGRQTKKLLVGTGLSKSLGGKPLFSGVDVLLAPGTRLGLLGPNGSGKSTLLKILSGDLAADTGTVTKADKLNAVVFEQGRSSLDLKKSLRRSLAPNADTVMFRDRPMHVAAWAQRFLFDSMQLDLELSALSGGERARVRIAQLMLQPADLLFLDEPTNDLDIPALEVLEDSLDEFPGAIVIVSHDRDLLDRLCTEVIGLDGNGNAGRYASVNQWLAALPKAAEPAAKAGGGKAAAAPSKKKLSFKEQKEYDGMEDAVVAGEEKITACEMAVQAAAGAGHAALTAACKELDDARAAVEKLYARWAELEARRG